MATHVVREGDSVTALGERHGLFDATIWEHPSNAKLAEKRQHMNELLPGDELFIPEIRVKRHEVTAGKSHRFRRKGIPAKLRLKVADLGLPRAEQDYTLTVGKQEQTGTTDDAGVLEVFVPAQAKEGTLVIGPDAFELTLRFGHQDPHDELSGTQRRLRNLGYLEEEPSGTLDEATRKALLEFEARHALEGKGEPSTENGGVLVEYHQGGRDFASKAERLDGEWPLEATGRTATMDVSLLGSSGGSPGGKGGGKESGALNVFDRPPPMGFYVIIGRGVTAWYDHLTMLRSPWGGTRLTPNLPVMHLGYPEPWARRRHERMGQWPRMLDFFSGLGPNLHLQPVPAPHLQADWVESQVFANNLVRVENHIRQQYLVTLDANNIAFNPNAPRQTLLTFQEGFASTIESYQSWHARGGAGYGQANNGLPAAEVRRWQACLNVSPFHIHSGDGSVWHNNLCPFRISVFSAGHHRFVYAHKIDVCTGPGQPRLFRNNFFPGNAALYQEHLPSYDLPPARYDQGAPMPRILNGNDYIGSQNDPNHTVLVFKGNPVAAQSVQSALDMPGIGNPVQRVWWVVNKSLHDEPPSQAVPGLGNDADVPGKRNLLEQIGNDALHGTEQQDIANNHPGALLWVQRHYRHYRFDDRLMQVGFHEIASFTETATGTIEVAFNLHPYGDPTRAVPQYIPRLAERSVVQMRLNHNLQQDPVEMVTRFAPEPITNNPRERLQTLTVDRVVYSLGQDRGPRSEGTAAYLVQLVAGMHAVSLQGFPAYITDGRADPDTNDGTGCVRVLGAAFMGGPGIANGGQRQALDQGHDQHGTRVPQEAPAGGGGMNMAVTNIARANQCLAPAAPMTVVPVRINFASQAELEATGLSPAAAQWIIAARSATDRGHTVAQYGANLANWATTLAAAPYGGSQAFAPDVQLLLNNANGQFAF